MHTRRILATLVLEKIGAGLWQTSAALYLTQIVRLPLHQTGLLLGCAGLAGLAGAPLAGALADRFPKQWLCGGFYAWRACVTILMLVAHSFWRLLPALVLWAVSDRGTAALQRLIVADGAGANRARFQAVARVATNIGLGLGALGAAAVFAVGTPAAYQAMIVFQGIMFTAAALSVVRLPGVDRASGLVHPRRGGSPPTPQSRKAPRFPQFTRYRPWRDLTYLVFVVLELPLFLDNSIMGVGLPLWIVHLALPHVLVSVVFVGNTLCVIALQLRLSVLGRTVERAAAAIPLAGMAFLIGCTAAAAAGVLHKSTPAAATLLVVSAAAITAAEMIHTITSWELAISLAPPHDRNRYIGFQGIAQAAERAGGPLLITSAVLVAGPFGWPVLGGALMALSLAQRSTVHRRLAACRPTLQPADGTGLRTLTSENTS